MTKSKKHHWLFSLWIKIRGLLALVIVLAGLMVGLMSLLLPFESLYQDRLQRFLGDQWGLAVEVGEVDGSWQGYGPYFSLSDLQLKGKQSLNLRSANLSVNVYQWLLPGGRTGIDLSINKAELAMIHSDQGASITINDDSDEARFTETLDRVLTSGSLRVDEMTLNLADESGEVLLAGLKADLLLEQDSQYRALQLMVKKDQQSQSLLLKSKGLKSQSLTRDANWYVQFNQFDMSELKDLVTGAFLPHGTIDGEIWLSAKAGVIDFVTGRLTWQDAEQQASAELAIEHLGQGKAWRAAIKVTNIQVKQQAYADVDVMMQRVGEQSQVKITQIPLPLLLAVYTDMKNAEERQSLSAVEVQGTVDQVAITYDHAGSQALQGGFEFKQLHINSEQLSLSGLAGAVVFSNDQAELLLDSMAGSLAQPNIFRGNLNWQQLSSQIDLDWTGDWPRVEINSLWCDCEDFALRLWSRTVLGEHPNLNLTAKVSDVEVTGLWKYWPHNVWNDKTIGWLDKGLLAGTVTDGFVYVQGEMIPQGFKKGAAEFISRAYTSGVDNLFHKDWPTINNVDAVAEFKHDQAHVLVSHAETMGMQVQTAQADINSFEQGILAVDLAANSTGNEIIDYIRQSPLVNNVALDEHLSIGGKQAINLNFEVPIKTDLKAVFEPAGTVVFQQGQFNTEHLAIKDINGPVKLDGFRLVLDQVPAKLDQAPILLDGEIITKTEDGVAIDIGMTGQFADVFLNEILSHDLPIEGEAGFQINITNQQNTMTMTAKSDLTGMQINLPAPMNKASEESKDIAITCEIPCQTSSIDLNYNNEIRSHLTYADSQFHLRSLQFLKTTGPDTEDEFSDSTQNESFGGQIAELDLDQWMQVLESDAQTTSAAQGEPLSQLWPSDSMHFLIDDLVFMSRQFTAVEVTIERLAEGLKINVSNASMLGHVVIEDDMANKGVLVQFERLDWLDAIDENALSEVVKNDQSEVPDLHIWVKEFSYGGILLGEMRMEMRNVADGVKIDLFNIKSALADINITGVWNKNQGAHGYSRFHIVMISERIADFLQTLGFNPPITNAQTLIDIHAEWSGVPSQFNVAHIDGSLDISIGEGQVLDQKPGFGRVLGLFNLTNLPRRLILDFSDVLADGLMFSSMEGHFEIKSGVASTDDFLIKASSAKIHINGDVGFADQSYAQTITVRPQIGKTFPTIGALAGGPVGAAAGFLVQGLFDKQLKNKNEIVYQVTGTWDDPQIDLISDD